MSISNITPDTTELPMYESKKRSDAISLLCIFLHIAFVYAPLFIALAYFNALTVFAAWLWVGVFANGLINLMHEAAHYHVFKEKYASDLLGRWILGPMVFANFDSYRVRHWDHHRKLGTHNDPKEAYHIDISGIRFLFVLLRCLLLSQAAKLFLGQFFKSGAAATPVKSLPRGSNLWPVRTCIFQGVILSSLLIFGLSIGLSWSELAVRAFVIYSVAYLYAIMSLTVFMATLRAIAEHHVVDQSSVHVEAAALRNFRCNIISRLAFGAYGFESHYTHHAAASIPYYHLTEITMREAVQDKSFLPSYSYLGVVLKIVSGR